MLQMILNGVLLLGNHGGGVLLLLPSERQTLSRSGYAANSLMCFRWLVRGLGAMLRPRRLLVCCRLCLWSVPSVAPAWLLLMPCVTLAVVVLVMLRLQLLRMRLQVLILWRWLRIPLAVLR